MNKEQLNAQLAELMKQLAKAKTDNNTVMVDLLTKQISIIEEQLADADKPKDDEHKPTKSRKLSALMRGRSENADAFDFLPDVLIIDVSLDSEENAYRIDATGRTIARDDTETAVFDKVDKLVIQYSIDGIPGMFPAWCRRDRFKPTFDENASYAGKLAFMVGNFWDREILGEPDADGNAVATGETEETFNVFKCNLKA